MPQNYCIINVFEFFKIQLKEYFGLEPLYVINDEMQNNLKIINKQLIESIATEQIPNKQLQLQIKQNN